MILESPTFWLFWVLAGTWGMATWKFVLWQRNKHLSRKNGLLLLLFFMVTGLAGFLLALFRDPEDFINY